MAENPFKSSLRLRLLLLVAGAMLPLVILSTTVVYRSYQDARAAAGDRLLQATRSASASVDREIDNMIAGLQVLALSPSLQSGDFAAFRAEARRFTSRYLPETGGIVVADTSGQEFINTNADDDTVLPRRANVTTADQVFATAMPRVSDIYVGAVLKRPIFTVEAPVMRDGKVISVIAFNPPRSIFFALIDQMNLPSDWVVSIVDRNNHHVARRPALPGDTITSLADSLLAVMAGRDEGLAPTVSVEGQPLFSGFTRSRQTGWAVAIGIPAQSLADPARQSFLLTLGAGVLLVLFGLAFAVRLAAQLIRAESGRELLINELNHRVKNTLSSVQAIVSRMLRTANPEARSAIEERLMALSSTHNILSRRNWESATAREIIESVLRPYGDDRGSRFRLSGPDIKLRPHQAITLAMVLTELATNAAKYGALASPAGVVTVTWDLVDQRLQLDWRESGGAPVVPPTRTGYGSQFIQRAVTQELRGNAAVSYLSEGLSCRIAFPL